MDLTSIFDLPLTELISASGDMCAAMAKLTGDTLPAASWEYLTVGELLSFLEGTDTVYKCGAIKPLFEGIVEKFDSVAEVYIFGRAPLFEGTRKNPYLVIKKCLQDVKELDSVYLWISTNHKGIESRRQIPKILLKTYDKVFGNLMRNHGLIDKREDVIMKLQLISQL